MNDTIPQYDYGKFQAGGLTPSWTFDCGCILTLLYDGVIQPAVDHCPRHKRSLELYDMLKELVDSLKNDPIYQPNCLCQYCKVYHEAQALLDEIGEKPDDL